MAGVAQGLAAETTFVENLAYACESASKHSITILIEPLNKYDAPGYFLTTTGQAKSIIELVKAKNLRLMFDCYHVQLMEGDLSNRLATLMPIIGHIQFASVPNRGSPDCGELNFDYLFRRISELGYDRPLGAEYKPDGLTDQSLDWMRNFQ